MNTKRRHTTDAIQTHYTLSDFGMLIFFRIVLCRNAMAAQSFTQLYQFYVAIAFVHINAMRKKTHLKAAHCVHMSRSDTFSPAGIQTQKQVHTASIKQWQQQQQ